MNAWQNIDRREMLKRLAFIGRKLEEKGTSITIYLFGSCLGMYHLDSAYRMSQDIDYQTDSIISDADIRREFLKMDVHEIGGIMDIPPLDELQVDDVLKLGGLTVVIPSIEDFALTKLLSNREKDYEDLRRYPILDSCDLKRLRQMVKEYEPYIPYGNTSDWNFRYLDDLVRERGIGQKKRNEMQK